MKKTIAALGLIFALTGCSTDQAPPPSHVDHSLPPKIALDVQAISLADRTGLQPSGSPYSNNHFTPTIDDAIKQWASDRMQAAGQVGQAIILIKEASLIAQPLPVQTGIENWFTRQQTTKYVGHAEVSIEANGREGFATADAAATRSVSLPENATPIERQDAYFSLLNGLMKDLGQNLETAIEQHMASFISATPVYGSTSMPMDVPPSMQTPDPTETSMPSMTGNAMGAQPMMDQAPPINSSPMSAPNVMMAPSSGSQVVIPLSGMGGQ